MYHNVAWLHCTSNILDFSNICSKICAHLKNYCWIWDLLWQVRAIWHLMDTLHLWRVCAGLMWVSGTKVNISFSDCFFFSDHALHTKSDNKHKESGVENFFQLPQPLYNVAWPPHTAQSILLTRLMLCSLKQQVVVQWMYWIHNFFNFVFLADNDVGMFITSSQDQSIRLSEVPELINFLSFYFSSYF